MELLAAVLLFLALAPVPTGAPPRGRAAREAFGFPGLLAHARSAARLRKRGAGSGDPMPQTLELLARALRAGASLQTAVEAVAADLPEAGLSAVVARVRRGQDMAEAIDLWAFGSAERQAVAALLVLGHESGAAMASSLDKAAASIRQRRALSDEIRALTAQTRISGVVVAVAPVGFGAVIALADREVLGVLFTTPVGLASLVLGVTLELLGVWWMSRLARGVSAWA